jgi:hypothetical protein
MITAPLVAVVDDDDSDVITFKLWSRQHIKEPEREAEKTIFEGIQPRRGRR